MSRPRLAIIGYGDFTKLMVKHLSPHFELLISSRQKISEKGDLEFEQVDLKTALAQELIIPSMPAQSLEEFFTSNKKLLNPAALIVDVCSVKVKPVETLKRILPESCQILATHPLFGPASAANGLPGLKVMMHPTRIPQERYQKIQSFLADELKLEVIECTPEEHDKAMAYAQGLSHYVGRLMEVMDIPESEISTRSYDDLLDMKRILANDSWELFQSIMFENPYALEVNADFKQAIKDLDSKLGIK